ncbi:hypothetical protein OIU74_025647 [Salix koriyanagi]|uniref:Uncharacterized protein n=1 Tax=Salix koriyanagi TaxID=2511006 RepID=A0A9Q1A5U9_9ROSI|nr:hypothetical protein OIU74_025647 [Salix koriyanagi]
MKKSTISPCSPLLSTSLNPTAQQHHQKHQNWMPFASISINTSNEDEAETQKKRSSLERVEEGLAKARAAIRSKNYTSHKKETFIPEG